MAAGRATRRRLAVAVLTAAALVMAGCSSTDDPPKSSSSSTSDLPPGTVTTTTPEEAGSTLLTSTDGYLLAVDPKDPESYQFISITAPSDPTDPASPSIDLAVHDQPCFIQGTTGRFAMPIDAGPGPGAGPTWGIFQLGGTAIGSYSASFVSTLGSPSYQPNPTGAEPHPYGCASLSDGRIATTDLGSDGTPTGQLTLWFGPFDGEEPPKACKLDTALVEPRGIWVDEQDRILVASAGQPSAGVWRYSRLPTGPDASGGCGGTDGVGAPAATSAHKDPFIPVGDHGLNAPSGITGSVDHGIFVSSAIDGLINEYDANGEYRTTVLAPQPGERLDNNETYFAGTPLGMAIDVDSTLYYADPGWTIGPGGKPESPEGGGLIQGLPLITASGRPELFLDSLTDPTSVTIFAPSGGQGGSPL